MDRYDRRSTTYSETTVKYQLLNDSSSSYYRSNTKIIFRKPTNILFQCLTYNQCKEREGSEMYHWTLAKSLIKSDHS